MSYRSFESPVERPVSLSEASWLVSCPTCEAWPGSPCKGRGGLRIKVSHPKRMQKADAWLLSARGCRA
jgi:hypothetical protein